MPEAYHIDQTQRLVWSRCWGVLSDEDMLAHQARLRTEPDFLPDFNQLIDTSEVTEVPLSAQTVRQVAQHSVFAPESKRAFVVTKDVLYGLGRMFELCQSLKGGSTVRVFRDRAVALAWLGVNEA